MFMCYSATTETGLNSVLLNELTFWQQVLLFLLMILGSTPTISIITLLIRRHFFKRKLDHLIAHSASARRRVNAIAQDSENIIREDDDFVKKLDPDVAQETAPAVLDSHPQVPSHGPVIADVLSDEPDTLSLHSNPPPSPSVARRRAQSAPKTRLQQLATSPPIGAPPSPAVSEFPPNSRTIEFRDDRTLRNQPSNLSEKPFDSNSLHRTPSRRPPRASSHFRPDSALTTGFGGFPNPLALAAGAITRRIAASGSERRPSVESEPPQPPPPAKSVPYFTFTPTVGRNSKFKGLTTEQQEELGGVEFRALTILLRIVVAYSLLLPLLGVLVVAPWLATSEKWKAVFSAPDTTVSPVWYTFFIIESAFNNCGLSLHDSSLIPFQTAYWLLIVLGFLILSGNTAFPIILRCVLWTCSKLVPKASRVRETLQFLLDHPRRCFLYLFPSHQTWYLAFVLLVLNCIDWAAFLLLDIGNEEIEAIPIGNRVFLGLFQAIAVRTSGLAIVSLATIAPALQVLYVSMFQVAAYPIAVTIRASNVYEERSIGVYEESDDEDEIEAQFDTSARTKKPKTTGNYIRYHARKQLAFDMWWLVGALWLLCIIERAKILDEKHPWITIFTLLFELSSSYGNIGLSTGRGPSSNTSLSGDLRAGSKLILIAVMVRGRHRGLPRAIDRSIMLPDDLVKQNDDVSQVFDAERRSRRGSGDGEERRRDSGSFAARG
ncbi:cation transport protein-domain-containing protein [Leucosporidium creatinivorum]|uniref:Potassium transport protein n=1 Tax=Leucosporidium creatinivorum TaxID=106004 RepID=A0A1Y2EVR9_9BASI|nr:cation transport protein-domain-containing protein [Leucosporidium creatinivorum]